MEKITYEWLHDRNVCDSRQALLFRRLYPEGLEVSRDNALAVLTHRLESTWVLRRLAEAHGLIPQYEAVMDSQSSHTDGADMAGCPGCQQWVKCFFDEIWPQIEAKIAQQAQQEQQP